MHWKCLRNEEKTNDRDKIIATDGIIKTHNHH